MLRHVNILHAGRQARDMQDGQLDRVHHATPCWIAVGLRHCWMAMPVLRSTSRLIVTPSGRLQTAATASVHPPTPRTPGNPSTAGPLIGQILPGLPHPLRTRLILYRSWQIRRSVRLFRPTTSHPAMGRHRALTSEAIVAVVTVLVLLKVDRGQQDLWQLAANQVEPTIGSQGPVIRRMAASHGGGLTTATGSTAVVVVATETTSHELHRTSRLNGKSIS